MTESNSTLILEGLVECGPCGRKMVTVHDPENRYACPVILQNGPDDCPTPPVTVEQLDTEAARWLAEKTLTERQLGQITREIMDNHAALRGPSEKDLEKARKGTGETGEGPTQTHGAGGVRQDHLPESRGAAQ